MKTKNILLNTFFVLVLGGALFYSYQSGKKNQKIDPTLIELESPIGKKSIKDFNGKYNLVYFGFLTCPDICPTTLKTITRVFNELNPTELDKIQLLFIDLDPERDSLDGMKIYTSNFHKQIIPLRTEVDQLKNITDGFGIYFKKVPLEGSNMGYTIDHSTGILFLDPKGELISVLDHDASVAQMLAIIRLEMKKTN